MTEQRRSTADWENLFGQRIRRARIDADLSQAETANRANISLGALAGLEAGRGSTLRTIVRTLRVLDQAEWLLTLAPEPLVDPLQMVRPDRSPRQRVARRGNDAV